MRFVQVEELVDGNSREAHSAVSKLPYEVWKSRMDSSGDHRVIRSNRTGRVLGMVSGYSPNAEERSFCLAVIKDPRETPVYWEGVAFYLDYLFINRNARKAYLEGSDEATRQWLHGAQRMFPGITKLIRPSGEKAWVLTRQMWINSIYSEGKWNNQGRG